MSFFPILRTMPSLGIPQTTVHEYSVNELVDNRKHIASTVRGKSGFD